MKNICDDCKVKLSSIDHDTDCNCGQMYCSNCEAEYNKEGELIAYGWKWGGY